MTFTWDAPAGGHWQLETVHLPGGQPLFFQELVPDAFKAGFQSMGKRYGVPIDYLEFRWVNDHCYARMRPVGAPEPKPGKASSVPPDLVFKALTRLHPELRRRTKTARRVLAGETWHEDLVRWENELRVDFLTRGTRAAGRAHPSGRRRGAPRSSAASARSLHPGLHHPFRARASAQPSRRTTAPGLSLMGHRRQRDPRPARRQLPCVSRLYRLARSNRGCMPRGRSGADIAR